MHLLLTDLLICPRCGPPHGLILLAERLEARRVLEGRLGCSNCREQYPVRGGFADLRPASERGRGGAPDAPPPGGEEGALRLAALLGVGEARAMVALAGRLARYAPGVSALADELEVVGLDPSLSGWAESAGVSRVGAARRVPFHDRSVAGVALAGEDAGALLEEAARVLAPLGRLVLEDAPADAADRLRRARLEVLASEGGTVVASRTG